MQASKNKLAFNDCRIWSSGQEPARVLSEITNLRLPHFTPPHVLTGGNVTMICNSFHRQRLIDTNNYGPCLTSRQLAAGASGTFAGPDDEWYAILDPPGMQVCQCCTAPLLQTPQDSRPFAPAHHASAMQGSLRQTMCCTIASISKLPAAMTLS